MADVQGGFYQLGAPGGAGAPGPSNVIHESGGPTDLTVGVIPDGQLLKRVGSTVVGLATSTFDAAGAAAAVDARLRATWVTVSSSLALGTAQPLSLADALFSQAAGGSIAGAGVAGVVAPSFANAGAETGTAGGQGGLGSAASATQPYIQNVADFPGQHLIVCELRAVDGSEIVLINMLSTAIADLDAKVYGVLSYRADLGANAKWRLWFYYDASATGYPTSFTPNVALTGCSLMVVETYPNSTIPVGAFLGPAMLGKGAAQIGPGALTDVQMAAANKDGATGTASMRTLGNGALQAAPGNDARLSDPRTPLGHHASHEAGGSDPIAVSVLVGGGGVWPKRAHNFEGMPAGNPWYTAYGYGSSWAVRGTGSADISTAAPVAKFTGANSGPWSGPITHTKYNPSLTAKIRLYAASHVYIGLMAGENSSYLDVNTAILYWDGSTGNWHAYTRGAGAGVDTDLGIAVAANTDYLVVIAWTATTMTITIDANAPVVLSTAMPSSTLVLGLQVQAQTALGIEKYIFVQD